MGHNVAATLPGLLQFMIETFGLPEINRNQNKPTGLIIYTGFMYSVHCTHINVKTFDVNNKLHFGR